MRRFLYGALMARWVLPALADLMKFWVGVFLEGAGGENQIYFHVGLTSLF
jgi:hypothetical protein